MVVTQVTNLIDRLPTGFVDDLRKQQRCMLKHHLKLGVLIPSQQHMVISLGVDARSLDSYDVILANGDIQAAAGYVLGSSRDNFVDFKMNTSTWTMGDMFVSATLQHFGEGKGVANNPPTTTPTGDVIKETERDIDAITYLDLQYGMVLPTQHSKNSVDNVLTKINFLPRHLLMTLTAYRTWVQCIGMQTFL